MTAPSALRVCDFARRLRAYAAAGVPVEIEMSAGDARALAAWIERTEAMADSARQLLDEMAAGPAEDREPVV